MKDFNVQVSLEDFYNWIGRLYIEKMQWEKAANMANAERELLRKKIKDRENDHIPEERTANR